MSGTGCVARAQTGYTLDVAVTSAPVCVGTMRCITAAFLRQRAVPAALAQDVVVVVSELVTNAVEHGLGGGMVGLRVRDLGWELLVEITDDNPAPARLCPPTDEREHGRGLLLVAALSESWGVSDNGRATWAAFRPPLGRPRCR